MVCSSHICEKQHQRHCNVTSRQRGSLPHLINGTYPTMTGQQCPKISSRSPLSIYSCILPSIHPRKLVLTQDSYISYLRYLALFGNGIVSQCQPMCHIGSFLLCQDSVTYPLNKGERGCVLRTINPSVLFVTKAMRGWYINVWGCRRIFFPLLIR